MLLPQLRRIRWAVRATLLLGVAASVLANILHALDNPISQAIAAWPPVALLLTVELISRVPVGRRFLAASRLIATAIIASIAAWVSYWHMAGVAARYGETGASPYLLPLSVDGLIVVASICLVELGGRIASLEQPATAPAAVAPAAAAPAATAPAAAAPVAAAPASQLAAAAVAPQSPAAASLTAASRGAADAHLGQPGDEVSHIMVDAFPEEPASTPSPDPGLIRAAAARTGANPVVTARAGSARSGSARVSEGGSSAVEMPSPLRRSTAAALAEAATALPRSTTGFNPTVTRGGGNAQSLGRSLGASANGRTSANAGAPANGRTSANAGAPGDSRSSASGGAPTNGRVGANGSAPGDGRGATNGGAAINGRASANGRGGTNTGSVPAQRRADSPAKNAPAGRSRRTPAETVALAARIKAERPAITEAELAAELGISPSRWRSVRREAAQTTDTELAA